MKESYTGRTCWLGDYIKQEKWGQNRPHFFIPFLAKGDPASIEPNLGSSLQQSPLQ